MRQVRKSIKYASSDCLALVVIGLLYLVLTFIVSPFHEFPLNDDVMYAEAVRTLLKTGRLQLSSWVAPSLLFQVAYGAAVSKLFGFSFTILRLTTLVMSCISTSILYLFLRLLNTHRVLAFCGALTLALNPIFLNLSYTFMTEVPFIAFMLLSLLCYTKGLPRGSHASVLAGSLFATAGLLIRQVGIILPLAAALSVYLSGVRNSSRHQRRLLLLSAGIPLGSFCVHTLWLRIIHGPTRALGAFFTPSILLNPFRLIPMVLVHGFVTVEYLGLFIVPLLPLWIGRRGKGLPGIVDSRLLVIWTGIITSGVLLMYLAYGKIMPYTGNILHPAGVGALTLKDAVFDGRLPMLRLSKSFWELVTLLASWGAVWVGALLSRLGIRLLVRHSQGSQRLGVPNLPALRMVALALLGFLTVGLLTQYLFDRYLLPSLVFLIPLLLTTIPAPPWKSFRVVTAVVLLLGYGAFGALGTRDYFAWNAARWAGVHYLIYEELVEPFEIDAGYEVNYWYNYANAETHIDTWWWVKDARFYFTFTPLDGYQPVVTIPYSRSLPPSGIERVHVFYHGLGEEAR